MLRAISSAVSLIASFASPPPIGSTTPNTGAFTTLTAGAAAVNVAMSGGATSSPAIAIAAGTDSNIVGVGVAPKGTGAFQLDVTDSTSAGGNARGANATDLQTNRSAAASVASGQYSTVGGGNNNSATAQGATALGGTSNTASGTNAIAGGSTATASGNAAVALGSTVTASGARGVALGIQSTDRGRHATLVFSSGFRSAAGDAQALIATNLRGTTTDAATGVRLTADGAAAGSANVVNLANTTALRFRILLVAMVANTSAKEWTIDGLARRGANAASTAFPTAATITSTYGDAGLATCTVACTADTTNGGINITVNGVAATTIQWCAFVQAVEVG